MPEAGSPLDLRQLLDGTEEMRWAALKLLKVNRALVTMAEDGNVGPDLVGSAGTVMHDAAGRECRGELEGVEQELRRVRHCYGTLSAGLEVRSEYSMRLSVREYGGGMGCGIVE